MAEVVELRGRCEFEYGSVCVGCDEGKGISSF
jgi:hypothetical protein